MPNISDIKSLAIAIIAVMTPILGVAWFFIEQIDPRYVKTSQFSEFSKSTHDAINGVRAEYLGDKIFELRVKIESGDYESIDKAMLERYRDQLNKLAISLDSTMLDKIVKSSEDNTGFNQSNYDQQLGSGNLKEVRSAKPLPSNIVPNK